MLFCGISVTAEIAGVNLSYGGTFSGKLVKRDDAFLPLDAIITSSRCCEQIHSLQFIWTSHFVPETSVFSDSEADFVSTEGTLYFLSVSVIILFEQENYLS